MAAEKPGHPGNAVESRLRELGLSDARKVLVTRAGPSASPTVPGYETLSGARSAEDVLARVGPAGETRIDRLRRAALEAEAGDRKDLTGLTDEELLDALASP